MTARLPDWRQRLWRECWRPASFKWGQRDCAFFVADCIKAMTGRDPVKDLRKSYKTETGARRLILQYADDLPGFVDARLGDCVERIDPADVQEGDILVIDTPDGPTGAVHTGGVRVACQGVDGVTFLFDSDIRAAWRLKD